MVCRICKEPVQDSDKCNRCWEIDSRIDSLPQQALFYFLAKLAKKARLTLTNGSVGVA